MLPFLNISNLDYAIKNNQPKGMDNFLNIFENLSSILMLNDINI